MRWKNQGGQAAVTVIGQVILAWMPWQPARFVQLKPRANLNSQAV